MKKMFKMLSVMAFLLCAFLIPCTVSAETTETSEKPAYTVLLLDISEGNNFSFEGEIIYTVASATDQVKTASANFSKAVLSVDVNHYIAVIAYDSTAETVIDFSSNKDEVVNAINSLDIGDDAPDMAEALELADTLLSSVTDQDADKNVVIFTTGRTRSGDYTYSGKYDSSAPGSNWYNTETKVNLYAYANEAYKKVAILHKYAKVYAIGLFDNWEDMPEKGQELVSFFKMFTEDLANPEENFYAVYDENDIDSAFADVCNEIIDNSYTDVTYQGYYFDAVIWADKEEITEGTDVDSFDPNLLSTRGQIVTFLWRAMGKPEPKTTKCPFKDVNITSYYYDAVLWASEEDITLGWTDDTFNPDGICTRGQIVTFLWRTLGEPGHLSDNHPFVDIHSYQYYYDAVLWAVENKVTDGVSVNRFAPENSATRAQIVTFMYRALAGK